MKILKNPSRLDQNNMPTVLRKSGFEFKINTDDHEPAHVHVWYQGNRVLINVAESISVRRSYGMNHSEIRRAMIIAGKYQELLQNE